ncbi:hypothetical protein TVAG_349400 [Trichomonas vaginalis G3]|uniref:Uncharacterized protein n=1 Tax=Trichomonas vaginalis (strain ATCC PRA-98 / G3) TaxID=412133 RepID=A2EML7_TRIV3|nr:hypothetical protein TVAGG3_0809930 [Trichomonas vaginalis G3]EAY06087.1 hypothetical protein TVAG_349400 [Trichomonas vaginalis G3]KAI5497126.1 hypothetical protein TVAGG3_0809930 [Trichomonas vaginalis G3]|eukprot:XP_001318310.1 hypothetical protein [Trichomonas vaginalis G3]
MDNVSFQQNNGIHQSMINIPDWLTTETHKISMKIISNDEIESNIINSTISISGMFYNSQNVAFMGNISLKQNVNAKRFNASFRNFADSSKSILLNDRINGYQYFDVILQFPSNLEYGIHIIDILAVNENDRVIGKKSIEFNYIKQTKYSHCMNIQSHIRKR